MSQVNTRVDYTLSATDAGASSAFAKLSKEMERSAAKASLFKQSASFAGNELDKFAKVGGIALIGRTLSNATEKALELRDAFKAGELSVSELGIELAKTIPILGDFVKAGSGIGKAIEQSIYGEADRFAASRENARDKIGNARMGFKDVAAQAAAASENIINPKKEANPKLKVFDEQLMRLKKEFDDAMTASMGTLGFYAETLAAQKEYDAAVKAVNAERAKATSALAVAEMKKGATAVTKFFETTSSGFQKLAQGLAEETSKRFAKQAELRARFAQEDEMDALEGRRDEIQNRLSNLSKARNYQTAQAMTDTGASSLIRAKASQPEDKNTRELQSQTKVLKSIDDQIKQLNREQKTRSRQEQVQEIFN
jgi:hypothetical protein